jgi:hypothetical protein
VSASAAGSNPRKPTRMAGKADAQKISAPVIAAPVTSSPRPSELKPSYFDLKKSSG